MLKQGLTVAAAAALLSGCVVVVGGGFPNPNLPGTHGSAAISPAQLYTVAVQAGGSISATVVGGNCLGYIDVAPDFTVNFSTLAGILPLIFSANSASDTTLVINDPNGTWHCNDDGGGGLNPRVQINSPVAGRYSVWVGTYSAGTPRPATLRIN